MDLKVELERLAREHAFHAACIVTCVGSLSHARLRMAGGMGAPEAFKSFDESMEIVSLGGTLSPDGLHLHLCLARADGACIGGHLVKGCIVNTTAEVVIGELPEVEFGRPVDPSTGYRELKVRPRP
jgi:predicted DNA-binding protein with PD1-like motif